MTSRYIFCDIDGTLLYAKGSGRPAFAAAFFDAFDTPCGQHDPCTRSGQHIGEMSTKATGSTSNQRDSAVQ